MKRVRVENSESKANWYHKFIGQEILVEDSSQPNYFECPESECKRLDVPENSVAKIYTTNILHCNL